MIDDIYFYQSKVNFFFLGNTNIDSEIFRYDLNSGKFSIYQRLRTNAAVDIKYFCFESPDATESFLIVANLFEKG